MVATTSIDLIGWLTRYCRNSRALAWLVAINTVLSLTLMITSVLSQWLHFDTGWIISTFALSGNIVQVLTHPWSIALYMFVQLEVLHLIFNLVWLFWFGAVVVDLSRKSLLPLYIGGGNAGALAFISVCTIQSSSAWIVGSSASALAIMSACAVWAPNMEIRFFLINDVKLKWFAPICILLCFIGGISSPGALAAHIGGVVFGIGYAYATRRKLNDMESSSTLDLLKASATKVKTRQKTVVPPPTAAENMRRAASGRLSDTERLDALLDKIRTSGYASLSDTERSELEALSKRLGH